MCSKYQPTENGYLHQRHSRRKSPPTGTDADLNMATFLRLFTDEEAARKFVESKRWRNGPVCPHCGAPDVWALSARAGSRRPVRSGVYKCQACREQFTVRVGTVMENSKIPIHKWLLAIHLMTSSKKGISSHQIARQVSVTQKTAWFLCHRIRAAMSEHSPDFSLSGTVEVDDTCLRGKPRVRRTSKRGRGTSKKLVLALVQRNDGVPPLPINGKTLHGEARRHVHSKATIVTEELVPHRAISRHFASGHPAVSQAAKEYVRVDDHGLPIQTNTVESCLALPKPAHNAIHHHLSKRHVNGYCDQRSFMCDGRKLSDGESIVLPIKGAEGSRLMCR